MSSDEASDKPFLIRNIPNAITFVTVACGFILMVSTSIPGISPNVCVFATFLGLLADIADGTAARKLQVKSKFGASFDQLADLTCFGIGPGIFFTRQALSQQDSHGVSFYTVMPLLAGYGYVACSTFRIARELIVHDGNRPLYFVGIPTNLACVVVVPCATAIPGHPLLPFLVIAVSAMMVMPVNIPKGLGIFKVTDREVTATCGKRHEDKTS
ncbi:unnamed protein product [Effrenium voratum]|uniref:CDP-diacylglycerol--serine O-phosphatidyltransferase n=1 Tax=Effrenium voratum TaxID=2562239 RepID=A0AA36IZI1_9DINO|nr:unnamed protein product [Effrenium voratum]CAJ1395728.1 unnamed protein product [Effrenium voratum]CAJ1445473.1 unnamed protein product [Effrenium voratum]